VAPPLFDKTCKLASARKLRIGESSQHIYIFHARSASDELYEYNLLEYSSPIPFQWQAQWMQIATQVRFSY
jgi:hypothetical protein